jgi:magnesium transporter
MTAASVSKVIELLGKQRLFEDLLRGQHAPNQDLVESVVHRQHVTELKSLLDKLPAEEIGRVLETIPLDDARRLWGLVPEVRANEVLWELSDALRGDLAPDREPCFGEGQINAFELVDGKLRQVPIDRRADLEGIRPIWIDLLDASRAERLFVGAHFGLKLPDPGDATDLEVSARFRLEENEELHLRSNFLLDREGDSRSVAVAFILHRGVLFSLRNDELPVFRLQRLRARMRPGYVADCKDLLIDLYGADVEYSADSLEEIYAALGEVGRQVLSQRMSDVEAASMLAEIAQQEDLNGRIRSDILDTHRALSFLLRCKILSPGQVEETRQILRDIESLNSHTAFLFDKINFLMDATIGFINVNQNRRVNQLTAYGVVFMPINIIAGIGGMSEFSMMTEGLPWPIAYGALILAMGLFGWGTFKALQFFEARAAVRAAKAAARDRDGED